MDKSELIKEMISIIEKVDDEKVLSDMKNLINGAYKHYVLGTWER